MEYNEFIEVLKSAVEKRFDGENVRIEVCNVVKTNDNILDFISIIRDEMIPSPVIYLKDYYDRYLEGYEIEDIVDEIIDCNELFSGNVPMKLEEFTDFEKASGQITFKLLNPKFNQKFLEKVPYKKFLDLAVVFYYTIVSPNGEVMGARILNEHIEKWNTDIDTLYELAKKNTRRLLGLAETSITELPVYFLSNKSNTYGAAAMLYDGVLENIAEQMDDDLYVIPASINEVLLFPVHSGKSIDELNIIIEDVNRMIEQEMVLSDHAYLYIRGRGFSDIYSEKVAESAII